MLLAGIQKTESSTPLSFPHAFSGNPEDRGQRTEVRGQRAESSTTLSFPHAFSGNPEDVMVPR